MIKFFRHIRQNLLAEGKTGKPALPAGRYFKYAIGEIVLVVIGILIALQINNWNESRKQKQNLKVVYNIIINDLEKDYIEIDSILFNLKKREGVLDKVISKTLTKEYLLTHPAATNMMTGYPDFSIQTRGYELLKNIILTENNLTNDLDSEISNFYKTNLLEIKLDQDFLSEELKENYTHWKSTYSWWPDYVDDVITEDFVDYAISSQDFRNRVATFRMTLFRLYAPKLKEFQNESKILIDKINLELNQK
ncbi:DUF6090 family protein [Lutimonas vermicola]|uniref:DUF6090 family protein n=1 Tax=Lutimonas vermicola TaxID=414288 RepID=A0ABU9L228_9FLAO